MWWRDKVKSGEGFTLLLSAAAFFCILTSYYIIRPVRDQLSGAVGSVSLPMFYGATFLATLALTPVFGALVARFSRRRLLVTSYSFFIVCLIAFVPAFMAQARIGAQTLGVVFFVWVSVFNLFVVSLFWSLMADLFDSAQSRRLFPLIAVGGTLGALAGPFLTSLLVGSLGVAPLLVVSAVVLLAALGIILWLSVRADAGGSPAGAIGGSILAGVRQAFGQPFVRQMALLMLLGDGVGTVAYALLADFVKAHYHDAAMRTAFYGHLDLATNLLVIAVQIGPTRWLLTRHGPGTCLVLAGSVNILLFVALAGFGTRLVPLPWLDWPTATLIGIAVPMLAIVMAGSRGFAYGMTLPASNALYTRTLREARYKGKNFVDTVVWRFGDLFITTALNVLRGLGLGVSGLALLSAGCGGVMAWIGARIERSPDLMPQTKTPAAVNMTTRNPADTHP